MTNEPDSLDIIKGSGNVYADFGVEDADLRQLKAKLAAEIIKALDAEKLTVRKAATLTGFAAADFSRIRQADLGRFTVDRLMTMVNRLGSRVEVAVSVRPKTMQHRPTTSPFAVTRSMATKTTSAERFAGSDERRQSLCGRPPSAWREKLGRRLGP